VVSYPANRLTCRRLSETVWLTQQSNHTFIMAGVGKLLKQAQKMQKKIEALEAEQANQTLEISSGGGAIQITITVSGDIKGIQLDPDFLKEEKSFVEETLVTGVQDAVVAARKAKEEAMSEVTAGMQMPGLM
jgi:nucleoid-associated protein EbfC